MAKDPYSVLGVAKEAKDEDIQKAFRNAAKKYHPDLNPGDKKAEDKFKEINAAYDIVGDTTKRARYDRGEIDASGTEIRQNPIAGEDEIDWIINEVKGYLAPNINVRRGDVLAAFLGIRRGDRGL